jgi:hypothetical protein
MNGLHPRNALHPSPPAQRRNEAQNRYSAETVRFPMQCRLLYEKTEWKHSVPAMVGVLDRHFCRPDPSFQTSPAPLLEIINAGSKAKINTDFYAKPVDGH